MPSHYVSRPRCVFTGSEDLEPLATFARFPVFMGCTDQAPELDQFEDMAWFISRQSGSIQLNPLLPLDVLYPDQHNEVVGALWERHHREFARFVDRYGARNLFEIGAAHGILARNCHELRPGLDWTILEPNPRLVDGARAKLIRGFFDGSFRYAGPIDAVVHSHVFEHVYFPDDFMAGLSRFAPHGKLLLFSVPNMRAQLESFFTNCLNFEHTCFLIEPYIDYLLAKHGFEVLEKDRFLEHSLFYAARRSNNVEIPPCPSLYPENRALFGRFVDYHRTIIADLNQRIARATEPVYLFGAHIFSQYLIALGLSPDRLTAVLDNGPTKIGKRLYGTNLQVASPKSLRDRGRVNIILKAGAYNREIREDILGNINPDAVFWE